MAATVHHMADHRAVFVLPDHAGTVVFLASRSRADPQIAHRRVFADRTAAAAFARGLAERYETSVVGLPDDISGEDAA